MVVRKEGEQGERKDVLKRVECTLKRGRRKGHERKKRGRDPFTFQEKTPGKEKGFPKPERGVEHWGKSKKKNRSSEKGEGGG